MSLIIGMLLDAMCGEPRWLWDRIPHPAVMMGRLIGWADQKFNTGAHRRLKGVLVCASLSCAAVGVGLILYALPGQILDILILAILLAQKSLVQHVQAVGDALRLSLGDARLSVAMIVGRDTCDMDAPAVARSAIESAAENLSDGVIAPIFWFALAGLPGLLLYKIVNTADSMIGYLTPRHRDFGWAAARFDDVLNLIPARLTAFLIWLASSRPPLAGIFRDAPQHRSPNAGWPEAAMAHGLNIALSGPRSYDGKIQDFPFVNAAGEHDLSAGHIVAAIKILWRAWATALIIGCLLLLL